MFSMCPKLCSFLILLKTSGSRFLTRRTFSTSSFVFEKNHNLRTSGSLAFYNKKNIQFWAFGNLAVLTKEPAKVQQFRVGSLILRTIQHWNIPPPVVDSSETNC